MRLLLGIVLGFALTVGGAYIADSTNAGANARPMVNWDVVGKTFDGFTGMVRDGWKKIAG